MSSTVPETPKRTARMTAPTSGGERPVKHTLDEGHAGFVQIFPPAKRLKSVSPTPSEAPTVSPPGSPPVSPPGSPPGSPLPGRRERVAELRELVAGVPSLPEEACRALQESDEEDFDATGLREVVRRQLAHSLYLPPMFIWVAYQRVMKLASKLCAIKGFKGLDDRDLRSAQLLVLAKFAQAHSILLPHEAFTSDTLSRYVLLEDYAAPFMVE